MLKNKNILIGITGGIAAYKAAELTRAFIKKGAHVKVIMTKNAAEFITPLTLRTLSRNPVYMDMFSLTGDFSIAHISLAREADVVVIAPATANVIGKIAGGLADDLLTTSVMATTAPVLICPAMNTNMYENPIVKGNLAKLAENGYRILEPAYGELAERTEGAGRLPEVPEIVDEVESILTAKDLAGEKIIVTAGPTQEPFDPVRFITNHSSGKMGYAVAAMARRRGADVVLISGPTALPKPRGVKFIPVTTALEMRDAVMKHLKDATVVIKAAAVADYRPATRAASKIKKKEGPLEIMLERNPDIIAEIGKKKGRRVVVGFAMETDNLIENAAAKLKNKNMDLIVANDLNQEGAGFQTDTNVITILDRKGGREALPLLDKTEVADRILDRVKKIL
ncbi:MAG: bifunctional phosphopantothenoylcysteine decarboxylase/phosphopantothenate--cysteine ligase CoaBC [Deltaproteobacteria bacterium]|nr:bifunctional phosphopantothenoylcysteine decarboxylase/phosphopantothenate--cysteine ligase CoaBC [Deltaproteobacteria bacterium]